MNVVMNKADEKNFIQRQARHQTNKQTDGSRKEAKIDATSSREKQKEKQIPGLTGSY